MGKPLLILIALLFWVGSCFAEGTLYIYRMSESEIVIADRAVSTEIIIDNIYIKSFTSQVSVKVIKREKNSTS